MTTVRFTTHNQGDRASSPATGWDVQCLQERSKAGPPNWAERHTARWLKGLAIDWNPDVLDVQKRGAVLAHLGLAGFSPNRGTLWVTGRLIESGAKVAVLDPHMINDPDGDTRAFGPMRQLLWNTHARVNRGLVERFEKSGHLVLFGGDINDRRANLPPLIRALKGHYDAIGYSSDKRLRLIGKPVNGGRLGSDHERFTATFEIRN